jgi:hypothetical protein
MGMALAMPALAFGTASRQATHTTVSTETRDLDGRTTATVAVTVVGDDGLPATGAVAVSDRGQQLAGAALNAQGQASIAVTLPAGSHSLSAVYLGDKGHKGSISEVAAVEAASSAVPSFQISAAPATLSLTPGQSGTVIASVTPVNASALNAPMFVTLSCSGLPDQSSCTFTPENVEILPNATAPITSTMVILTQAQTVSALRPAATPVAWAFLLPGILGLGGLAWGARRRAWLSRLSLLALVALVTMLGTTACAPRYDYYNHGPQIPLPTPAGTYTVNVTAQSSNGVSATTLSTTIALTVQ